jgi:hypothetical protein
MVSQSFLQVADLSQQFQGNLSNKNKSYPPGTLVNQGVAMNTAISRVAALG